MQAIKRIIPKTEFKKYDIPENFGEQAEMIILPSDPDSKDEFPSYELMKMQEKSGMTQMLNEPEEEIWNEL